MLEAYKKLMANGVIGPMMKVNPSTGQPIHDPGGDQPGQLVPRPFAEYPKAVRRVHRNPETGEEKMLEFVAHSKAEELKIMSDTAEMDVPRSPLERERDSLAEELATQSKLNGKLATQLENAMARIEQLAASMDKLTKQDAQPKDVGGFQALKAEHKATANKT